MSTFLIALVVLALLVSAVYAVLARGISPLGPVRRAGVRGASRRRDPQRTPRPLAPRRDALPLTAEQLGELLLTRPWESRADTPELAVMSAHENHGYYPGCPICAGDEAGLTRIAEAVLRALLDEMAAEAARQDAARTAAQLPIVGVDSAVRDYRRQMAEQIESTGYYGEELS
ncbi:hypothetical protein [Nocardia vulneris]|uniref:Uncharacterized protein n=1 Tax=Nocardia vulneris TaxID=1141657 RepID=A0ABR4ZDG4_9NOCA|nr:hypothetical protein [Nocardia vulneris]KIA63049.1 hypothetical protein FG87_22080 [Nocardia vulneris]